jgi:hypothetical protein
VILILNILALVILSFQVTEALARAGLESSNLILGIDFTKSNEWTGKGLFVIFIGFKPKLQFLQCCKICAELDVAFREAFI